MPLATHRTGTRAPLSAERILDAALELVDDGGEAGLTFRRLGQRLGADPTAVYRYFRSKDDLLLALADRIIDDALSSVGPRDGWRPTLRALTLEGYRALLRHPRLATLVAARTTQGPGEARAIESILAALAEAGLPPEEAVEVWRVLADTMLAWAGLTASFRALPPDVQAKDESAWTHTYASVSSEHYPHLAAAGPYLFVEPFDPFPLALDLLLDGVDSRIAAHRTRSQP